MGGIGKKFGNYYNSYLFEFIQIAGATTDVSKLP